MVQQGIIRYQGKHFVHAFLFQISMIASIYTTIALALERYLSIRDAASTNTFSFPCRGTAVVILIFSVGISAPRFFELRPIKEEHTTLQVRGFFL